MTNNSNNLWLVVGVALVIGLVAGIVGSGVGNSITGKAIVPGSNNAIYVSDINKNVGIGTVNPTAKLEVNGSILLKNQTGATANIYSEVKPNKVGVTYTVGGNNQETKFISNLESRRLIITTVINDPSKPLTSVQNKYVLVSNEGLKLFEYLKNGQGRQAVYGLNKIELTSLNSYRWNCGPTNDGIWNCTRLY